MPQARDAKTGRFISAGGGSGGGGGGFDLGTAYGRIVISTDGIDAAINSAQNIISSGLSKIGDSFRQIGEGFSQIGGALTGLTAPLAVVGGAGLKAAADFDTLMRQIEIFGNVAPDQLDTVRQFALKMGADTKFSSGEAASAMLDLLKSGQSVEQAMATLPTVLNLAAAGELGLAEAAGVVSSGLAIYKLKAEDAGRVSDALAKAANASRADVRDLGQALTNAGPVAAQFGLNVEQTAAILGVFAQNGVMGAEAGTQLRSMLLNLNENTPKTKAAWAELGISLYDAQGNMRDLNTVIKEMDAAMDKLPVEDQNRLMQQLGGSYGIVGLSALRAAGGIDDMMAAMDQAPGAQSIAESFMNSFKGGVESLTGSIETLWIEVLTPFMNEVLTPLIEQGTDVINKITEWAKANPKLTSTIVKILAVLIALGPILLIVGKAIGLVIGLLGGFGTVLGVIFSPLGLIIAGLVALYLAFRDNFGGIRDILQPVIDNVVTGIKTLFGVLGNLGDIIQEQGIGTAIASVVNAFMQMFGLVENDQMAQSAMDIGNGIVSAFLSVVQFITTQVLPTLQALANWFINDALPTIVNFISSVVIPIVTTFVDILGHIWAFVGPALSMLFNWFVTEGLPFISGLLKSFVDTVLTPAVSALSGLWEAIKPSVESLYNWFITDGLPFINEALTGFKDTILQPTVDILLGIWTLVSPVLGSLYDWFITKGLPFINDKLSDFKTNYLDPAINTLTMIWEMVRPHLENFRNGIASIINYIKDNVLGPFIDTIQKALDLLLLLSDQGTNRGVNTADKFLQNNPFPGQGGQSQGSFGASAFRAWQTRDNGGKGIAGMPYLIGAPQMNQEVYVPNTNGQFIPNFMEMMASMGGDSYQVQIMLPESALADAESARQFGQIAGDSFEERVMRRKRGRGGY